MQWFIASVRRIHHADSRLRNPELPLLQIASEVNGQEVPLVAAVEKLATQFQLTPDERHELLPSRGTFKFSSRVSWARTYICNGVRPNEARF